MSSPPLDDDDAPSWRVKLSEARKVGWLSLTPEEREVAAADRRVAREKKKARRRLIKDRRRLIVDMAVGGAKVEEIVAFIGMKAKEIRYQVAGLIAERKGFRRLFVWIADEHVAALDGVARDLGIDRGRALERLLAAVLADGGHVARRTMGVRRKAEAA